MGDSASRSEVFGRSFGSITERLDFMDRQLSMAVVAGGGVWTQTAPIAVSDLVEGFDAEGFDAGGGAAIVVKLRSVGIPVTERVPGSLVVNGFDVLGDGHLWSATNLRGTTGPVEPTWGDLDGDGIFDGEGFSVVWWEDESLAFPSGTWEPDVTPSGGYFAASGQVWSTWNTNGTTGPTEPDWASVTDYGSTLSDENNTYALIGDLFEWAPNAQVERSVDPNYWGDGPDGSIPVFCFPEGSDRCFIANFYGVATVPEGEFIFDSNLSRMKDGPVMWADQGEVGEGGSPVNNPTILTVASGDAVDGRLLVFKTDPRYRSMRFGVPVEDTSMPSPPGVPGTLERMVIEDDGSVLYGYDATSGSWLALMVHRED